MRLFGMGMPELLVILVVILIIFGPKNLPKLGSALGKAVKGVREGVDSVTEELGTGKGGATNAVATEVEKPTVVVEDIPKAQATSSAVASPEPESDPEPGLNREPKTSVKYCNKCGEKLSGDSRFCNACGADQGDKQ